MMTINAQGKLESKRQLAELEAFYKREGYNNMLVVRSDAAGRTVSVSHYWALDFQLLDTSINQTVRYKLLYVGTPESFTSWQREIVTKIEQGRFTSLQIKPITSEADALAKSAVGGKPIEIALGKKETVN